MVILVVYLVSHRSTSDYASEIASKLYVYGNKCIFCGKWVLHTRMESGGLKGGAEELYLWWLHPEKQEICWSN